MAIWTVTNIVVNTTYTTLFPVTPKSAAVWYGSVETSPETISREPGGRAGKFRATEGTATGVTGISVYVSPDLSKAIFLLIMMPFGAGEVNQTKAGFIDVPSNVDKAQVKRLWYDDQFGTSASYSGTDSSGKSLNLYLESKIEQGTNVQATFTLTYKK